MRTSLEPARPGPAPLPGRAGLTQDEQQLLGSAQSEDRDEAASLPVDDVMDRVAKAGLALLPLLMDVGPVGGLLERTAGGATWLSIKFPHSRSG